jgi:dihydrofolate reductase
MSGRARVFIASSLDGFIAAEDDDISWLPRPDGDEDYGYGAFMGSVGAVLMGRRTYGVVSSFDEWPFAERPVLVATHWPLRPAQPHVRAVSGHIHSMVREAKDAADGRDVYVDGGQIIRQALDENLVDEIILTLIPIVLGRGRPLFIGARRHRLVLKHEEAFRGGLVQLTYEPLST